MQTKTRKEADPHAGTGRAARIGAVVCVFAGVAGQAVFTVFVLLLGLDWLPERAALPGPWPWVVNVGWLTAFAAQHSGMARGGFKRAWARVGPAGLERAVYVAVSGLLVLGISLTWQPLPGEPLWRLPAWFVAVALAGFLGTGVVLAQLDQGRFFGLRQVWQADAGASEGLCVVGPYRYVRHPLMTCSLLFLWGLPVMSPTLALLSGGLTAYILLALPLEERDLLRQFGPAYAAYRRRVPALLPWWPPAARAVHDASRPS
jgi:protein-S-isoprenylcysteine O-methyltransferase Ste14